MKQIASSIPGRLRLRDPALRDEDARPQVLARLLALPGVTGTESKPHAGSVTVHYDRKMISPAEFVAMAVKVLTPPATKKVVGDTRREWRRSANRYAKYGALASLAASLAFAAAGRKRAHIVTGGVFLVFLGVHTVIHRRNLWR